MTPKDPVARPRPWRRRVLLGAWLTAAAIICVRAVQIQVVQSQQWRAVAEAQHRRDEEIVAARGSVLDRDGTPLAVSRERFSVGIAPNELINVEDDVSASSIAHAETARTRREVAKTARSQPWDLLMLVTGAEGSF